LVSRDEALSLLRENSEDSVFEHSLAVSVKAKSIAGKIRENGYDVDVNFVEIAAILHDIGRSKTHGIRHGIEGAEIILKLLGDEKLAGVCERHIGAGITKSEAKALGLPEKDYLPETLEEKIIAHADNLTFGTETVSIDKVTEKFEKRLGRDHPSVKRILELNNFIENLLSTTKQEAKTIEGFGKEVMEKDVLNKIKWDKQLNPKDFSIRYIDRTSGPLKQVKYTDIEINGDFMKIDDSMIPMHRIREIRYGDKVVWNKRRV